MANAIPQEGTSSNRYTILGRLAGGGMADIFLARSANEAGVERYVVLKRVLAERSRDPHFATMFLDEARLAAQLQHPNVAQVHDIGKLGGSYFYTMEYVHGEDVRHVLQRLSALRRKLPVNLALHIAVGALAGLQHAHTRTGSDGKPLGVIHRDVSPSNVMVSFEGGIKLLDFGVAKAAQRSAESRAGTIKGKIMYLSPEQCQGGTIDRRSDIYSLGIVLHEMLTGRRLYKRETEFQTMMAIVSEVVAPPSSLRPEVSADIDAIVATALSKDRDQRYATATDMIEAIEAIAAREGHVLSVTAAGKFLRELFGERPEPWLELAARDEDAKQVTVTGESVDSLDSLSGVAIAAAFSPSGAAVAEQALEAQLDQAPAIGRPPEPEPSGLSPTIPPPIAEPERAPLALPLPPPAIATPLQIPTIAPPKPKVVTTVGIAPPATASSSGGYPNAPPEYRSTGGVPALVEPTPMWRRRGFVIAASALTVVLAIVVITHVMGGSAHAPVIHDAGSNAVVAVSADAAGVVAVTPDAAIVAAEGSGSAEVVAPVAATITSTFAAGDWATTLELCRHTIAPTTVERTHCGVAACNARQRAVALGYFQAASTAAEATIERACHDHGIALRAPKTTAPKNPCDDKQYREQNPLKCQ